MGLAEVRYISDVSRSIIIKSPMLSVAGIKREIASAPLFYLSSVDGDRIKAFEPEKTLLPANPCWIEYHPLFCACFFELANPMWALFVKDGRKVQLAGYGEFANEHLGTSVEVVSARDGVSVDNIQKCVAACAFAATFVASLVVEPVEMPVSGLRKMKARGHSVPIFRHYEVDLNKARAASATSSGGTHASPAWHIRRGHMRRTPSGKMVFVRSCEVGSKERGVVLKDYRVGTLEPPARQA